MSIAEQSAAVAEPMTGPGTLRMTEAEFDRWHDEGVRGEWIDGEVVLMSPASNRHVQIQMLLSSVLHIYCRERGLGEVRGPEFAIRIPNQRRRRTPDLFFVRSGREESFQETFFDGAPDAIFEIVSPDSVRRDWRDKYHEYDTGGVGEYWIIDPLSEVAEAYGRADEGSFRLLPLNGDRINSTVISGFFLKPQWLFSDRLATPFACLRELGVLPAI